jgi:hypothetical protein
VCNEKTSPTNFIEREREREREREENKREEGKKNVSLREEITFDLRIINPRLNNLATHFEIL